MDYLLDTNICIHYFKGQFEIKERIEQIGYDKCAISEITLAELLFGVEKSQHKEKNRKVVEHFADKTTIIPIFQAILVYAKEKARLRKEGNIISDLDLFIGATAIYNKMTLVTRNVRELGRLEDIKIENWIDVE